MPIELVPPKLQRNYWDAAFHGMLATLEAINPTGPNIPNVLSNIKSGFSAIKGVPEDSPGHRAWVWAFKTLSYAVSDLLKHQELKSPLSDKKSEAVTEFLNAATDFTGQKLDETSLINPGLSPIFSKAQKLLGPMLLKSTTGHDLGLATLDKRFKQALRTGSNRALCDDPTYFRILEDALTGVAGEAARRDGHWSRHSHWISHQFTDAPIFSPNEEDVIPLEAVYIPLRCFWHDLYEVEEDGEPTKQTKRAFVADLHETTHKWLSAEARIDPLLIVTGGPGSGKSSYARAFAHEIIKEGSHRVLFIQLQHMTLTGSLYDDIARYVDHRDTATGKYGNPGLPDNPLEWRKVDDTPILMIFDGLDELSTREEDGERYARELLLALKLMLSSMNTDGTPLRALVLGRNLACQAAIKTANIPLRSMLNVAPIAKMSRGTCMMPSRQADDISDLGNLMELDQREEYWRKWAFLKGLNPEVIPEAITAESMEELNIEPLLLHLLMVSKYSGDDWEVAVDNKNVVYEDILQKIFERNQHKQHFQSVGITESLFFELMECLGIAAWRGNGRTGGEEDFKLIRKLHLDREKQFRNFPAANLKSVALNIHTRAGQDDTSGGFEFIHKSFGEYLAARGLLSHTLKIAATLEDKDPEDVEVSWGHIIGASELTEEIIGFLYNEARRTLNSERALKSKIALTELLDWIFVNGISVHRINPDLPWTDLATHQRCAVSALLASTSAIATAIPIGKWEDFEKSAPWTVNIPWRDSERWSTKHLLSEIGTSIERPIISALRRISLNEQHLWDASLSRINFEGADLRFSVLTWSLCIDTNFANACLKGVGLSYARLKHANLRGCDLSGSDLEGTILDGVDMRNCNLSNSNLTRMDASGSMPFSFPNPFTSIEISGAADFEGIDLTGSDLSDADLSGVLNLSLEAVNSAIGTASTKFPDYIDREKVTWLQQSAASLES